MTNDLQVVGDAAAAAIDEMVSNRCWSENPVHSQGKTFCYAEAPLRQVETVILASIPVVEEKRPGSSQDVNVDRC